MWDLGNPLEAPSPKGEKTHPGHTCTIVQSFTPIGATAAEISVTKKKNRTESKLGTLSRTDV